VHQKPAIFASLSFSITSHLSYFHSLQFFYRLEAVYSPSLLLLSFHSCAVQSLTNTYNPFLISKLLSTNITMRYSTASIIAFATLAVAFPTPKNTLSRRAAVLADTTYDAISISGGVAGDAEAEALAVFSAIDMNDLANVDPADIKFLGAVNDVANDAETDAFNVALEAGDDEATQNGKIKNKVLKLMATKIELMAKAAQGEDTSAKLAEETKKLNNNIALDAAAAGQASTALPFDATISGGGDAGAAATDDAAGM
jgi:hypothetical protein